MRRRSPSAPALLALALALAAPGSRARALYTNDGSQAQQEIGYSAPGAVGFLPGLDFTGVGVVQQWTTGGIWGTAIAPDFVVSATHFAPTTPLEFTTSTGQLVVDPIVASVANVGGTDLYVARLAFNLPSTVATYAIAQPSQVAFDSTVEVVGLEYSLTVGQGVFSGSIPGVGAMINFQTSAIPGPYASYPTNGDSGAPTFAVVGGSLALVGVHYAGGYNYIDTDLTGLVPAIDAAMASMGSAEQVAVMAAPPAATPEPSSVALLGVGLAAALAIQHRRRQALAA